MTLLRDTPSYGVYFCVYHFAVQGLGRLMYPAVDPRQQQQQQEAHTMQQRLVHTEQQEQQSAHTEQPLVVQASSVWEGAEQPEHRLSLVQQPPQLMQQQQHAHLEQEPQQQQQEQQPQKQVNPGASQPLVQFIAGGLAGAIAWMSIYPIDVIKCRMQVCVGVPLAMLQERVRGGSCWFCRGWVGPLCLDCGCNCSKRARL